MITGNHFLSTTLSTWGTANLSDGLRHSSLHLKTMKMRPFLIIALLSVNCLAAVEAADRPDLKTTSIHVAIDGRDDWPGTVQKPFATLHRAREAVRARKQQGPAGPLHIEISGGTYDLTEPLTLTPLDSGTASAPVTWKAAPGQHVVLRGCRQITGWQPWTNNIYCTDLKKQGLSGVTFWQLFYQDNGKFSKRQTLARYPNFDSAHPRSGGNVYAESQAQGRLSSSQIIYRPGDLPFSQWSDLSQAEVVSTYNLGWMFAITPIQSVDPDKHVITVRKCRGRFLALNRFYIQNILDALDAPGEWYLDRRDSMLYFYPPDEKFTGKVLAPVLDQIISLEGSIPYPHGWLNVDWKKPRSAFPLPEEERKPVEHIRFEGLDFECARQDAIRMTGTRACEIIRCRICNTGNAGINIGGLTTSFPEVGNPRLTPATGQPVGAGGGGQILLANNPGEHCRIEGCDVWETGCEGIVLYGDNNIAENNHVWDIGLYAKDCPCINLLGSGNTARRNTLHDCPRCAIFIKGDDNIIELNDVHHAVLETCDMGAIRFVNRNMHLKGNVVRHNLVRATTGYGINRKEGHTFASPHFTWGIYLDDFTCNTVVEGNIITGAARGGVMIHGGGNNLVVNNLIVNAGAYQVEYAPIGNRKNLEGAFAGNRCERNVLVCTQTNSMPYRFTRPDPHMPTFSSNVVWYGSHEPVVVTSGQQGIRGWEKWLKKGYDTGSIVADPKINSTTDNIYTLSSDSPAWRLGFKPIPMNLIGCYQSLTRASWPITPNWKRPREKMLLFHEPGHEPEGLVFDPIIDATKPIDEDFESFKIDARPASGDVADNPSARITVTDEIAADGSKCLRIPDAADLPQSFLPRIYWPFDYGKGVAVFSADFHINAQQPAYIMIEPRQYGQGTKSGYICGPALRIGQDGNVKSPSGILTKIPLGKWVHFELRMPLTEEPSGTSQVTITVRNHAPQTFTVKNGSANFKQLDRVVIASLTDTSSLFHIDNVCCKEE
jgi:parallel beta-helix repeat protein